MTKEELKELQEKLKKQFNDEINEVAALDNESYNIFSILGYNSRELKHSRFMRWLLSFDAFFDKFTKACGIEISSDTARKINLEETYNQDILKDENIPIFKKKYVENKENRRIDINIIGGDFSITIENKVDTGEHNDQCISYYNYMMDKNGKYNYIDNSNKFFVFLAKQPPKDFSYFGGLMPTDKKHEDDEYDTVFEETGRKMKFFNYRLITYKDVLGILQDEEFKKNIKEKVGGNWDIVQKLLKQFTDTIEEWDKLGEGYIDIFDNSLRDKDKEQSFYNDIIKNLKSLKEDEDESDLGRFVEVASDYYDELKQKTDSYIKPALEAIISDNITLKTDYDGEKYANAIPIAIRCAGDDDIIRFICDKIISDDDEKLQLRDLFYKSKQIKAQQTRNKRAKNKSKDKTEIILDVESKQCLEKYDKEIAGYLKEIKASERKNFGRQPNKGNVMFQTVDFRAPMGDSKHITIGIYAGLKCPFSRKLCDYVLKDGFKEKYNTFVAEHNNAKFTWQYTVKDGSGENPIKGKSNVNVNFDTFYDYFHSDPELAKKSYVGEKNRNKKEELIKGIRDLKNTVFEEAEAAELIGNISSYFDKGNNEVNCQWELGITFELKDFPGENGKIDMQALAETFYKTTLEGMKLFGYDEYFEKQIFKPEAERIKAIKSLKSKK